VQSFRIANFNLNFMCRFGHASTPELMMPGTPISD